MNQYYFAWTFIVSLCKRSWDYMEHIMKSVVKMMFIVSVIYTVIIFLVHRKIYAYIDRVNTNSLS